MSFCGGYQFNEFACYTIYETEDSKTVDETEDNKTFGETKYSMTVDETGNN